MNLLKLSAILFIFAPVTQAQPSCGKPYQLGHFVQLGSEDLRQDRTHAATSKQLTEWSKKQTQAQAACNALVSQHPNQAVSKEFSFTVKGLSTVRERCDSFCGTQKELDDLYEKETK